MHSKLRSPDYTAGLLNQKRIVKLHVINLHYRAKKNYFALLLEYYLFHHLKYK